MPKMRTHSGCKKRFKKNSNGKVKRAKAYKRHHAWAKSTKQKRKIKDCTYFSPADQKNIAGLMPY